MKNIAVNRVNPRNLTINFQITNGFASLLHTRILQFGIALLFILFIGKTSFGQAVGDYRSNAATMNWSTDASWEIYNGSAWVAVSTEGYPGELGVSGTVTIQSGHTVTLNVSPANNIGSFDIIGSLNLSTGSININGTTIISGSLTDNSNTGTNTFTGKVTINVGGSFSTGNTSPLNFGGGIENNGTFSQTAAGVITFTADQTLSGTNVITTTGNINITAGRTLTNSGSVSISGVLNNGNSASTWINSDNSTLTYLSGTLPMNTNGTLTASATGNTVIYNRNNAQTVKITDYYNLNIANGNTKTLASNTSFTIFNNLNVALATTFQALNVNGTGVLTIDGDLVNDGTINMRLSATRYMNVVLTKSTNAISANGAYTFNTLTIGGDAVTWSSASIINMYGDFLNNTITSLNITAGTFYFNSGGNQSIGGTSPTTFNDLTINNADITLNNDVTVTGVYTMNNGGTTFNLNAYNLTINGSYVRTNGSFIGNAASNLVLNCTASDQNLSFTTSLSLNDLTINNSSASYFLLSAITTSNYNATDGVLTLSANLTTSNFNSVAGVLQNNNADRTFTVNNDITIAPGFTLRTNQTVTANRIFTVRTTGNFTNNGTVDLYHFTGTFHSMGELQFNGATDVTLGGTSTSEIGRIRVDKGTGQAAIVDVISPITLYNADVTYNQNIILTNGTLKISSASTLLPYYGDRTIFNNSGRLWLNNASASIGWNSLFGFCNFSGTLKIDQGTFTMGDGNDYFQIDNSGVLDMTGGLLNIYGRLTLNTGATPTNATFTMSGGEIKVDPQHTFNIPNNQQIVTFSSNSVVNFTGGTLTVVDPLFDRQDLNQNSIDITGYVGAKNFIGSTIQFGDGISVSNGDAGFPGFCIWTPSAVQLGNIILNNPGGTSRAFVNRTGVDIYCNNLTITTLNDQYITSGRILDIKGNFINNGVLNASSAGSHLRFTGLNAQAFSGTGSITATIPTLTFNNTSATGVTLNAPLGATTVNLTDGNVYTSSANLLTVYGTSPTTSLVGGGVNSFVVGPIRRTIAPGASSDYIFPIGEGTNYRSFEMIGTVTGGSGTGYITAEAIVGSTGGTGGVGIVSSLNAENTYWEIQNALNTVSITSVDNIQLYYTKPPTPTKTIGQSNTGLTGVYNPIGGTQTGGYVASDPGKYNLTGINPNGTTYLVIAEETPDNTWYSLISGDWDNWETWTLDPSGALPINPGHLTPSTSPTSTLDDVVIINGKTVTVNSDTKINDIITVNGRLDINTTTGHSFNKIRGTGRILLQGDNFPAGDATHFVTEGQGEGTVVYQTKSGLTSYNLATARTFFNVEVELFQSTDIITQLADYTINGSLTINKGVFQINDNTATTILNLTVAKDVLVESIGSITVGTGNTIGTYVIPTSVPTYFHSIFHQFKVSGNFTNNGIVKLTNLTAPDYNSFATNGAVTLTMQGAANNSMTLNNTSWLYNLIIDKGIDKSYILDLYSANTSYFVLFGPNSVGRSETAPFSAANPQVRKALWVKNGTLKLTGNILIPSLSEGQDAGGNGDYAIGQNARFWIAGANVTVYSTASNVSQITGFPATDGVQTNTTNQAMSVYGEYKITDGFFSTRNSAGFIFWAAADAQVKIEGGVSDVAQFRAGGGAGVASYIQTGGQLIVRGNQTEAGEVSGAYPLFGFDDATGVFNMSGGEILMRDISVTSVPLTTTITNGFYVPSAEGNYSVTGGTVTIETASGNDFEISSTAPIYNLVIKRLSGAGVSIIRQNSNINVLNDFTLGSNTQLDVMDDFDNAIHNLSVGRNFTIEDNALYQFRTNTTTFNGTEDATLYIGDITALTNPSYVDPEGAAAYADWEHPFYKFVVNKPSDKTLFFASKDPGDNGSTALVKTPTGGKNINDWRSNLVKVIDDFELLSGRVDLTLYSLRLYDDITNYGILAVDAIPTNSIVRTRKEAVPSTRIVKTTDNAYFGNLRLNCDNTILQFTSNVYIGRMEYKHGRMYISKYNLKIDDLVVSHENEARFDFDGDGNANEAGERQKFSVADMIITDGNASDGGLSLLVNSAKTYYFPIGVGTDATELLRNNSKFTPVELTISSAPSSGYITIRPVDAVLQTTNLTGGNVLDYYWRISCSGFTTNPAFSSMYMLADDRDIPTGTFAGLNFYTGWVEDGIDANANGFKFDRFYEALDDVDFTRTFNNYTYSTNKWIRFNNTGTDVPPTATLVGGNFTAGVAGRFTGSPRVFYTRTRGDGYTIKWNNGNNWTFAPTDLDLNGQVDPYEYHDRNQPVAGTWPVAGDIAVIGWIPWGDGTGTGDLADGAPHGITADDYTVQCASLIFNQMLDASGNPTSRYYSRNFQFRPTLCINSDNGGINTGTISGEGMFWIRSDGNQADPSFAGIDIGDFVSNDSSYFVYESTSNAFVYNNIPAEVPNLLIAGNGWGSIDRDFTISTDLNVRQNFELLGDVNLVLSSGATGNISVGKNLRVFRSTASGNDSGGDGEIAFPNNASRTVEVFGDVELVNSNAILRVRTPNAAGIPSNLIVHGNLLQNNTTGGGFQLYTVAGQDYINLTLKGSGNHSYTVSSGTTGNFYNLTLDKGTDQTNSFTLNSNCTINGPTSGVGVSKAITLINGKLILNNPLLNLNLTTGNDNFVIPATAAVEIRQGRANATGNSGIFLNGLLEITGGTLDMSGGNNFIEYTSDGNSTINITSGSLTVGSQIRRQTTTEEGILKFTQTGGTVILSQFSAPQNNRGVLEILNAGSSFTQAAGAKITIANAQTAATFPAVYLAPENYSLGLGSEIQFGNANTNASQTIGLYSNIPLQNISTNEASALSPKVKVKVWYQDITFNENVSIAANTELNSDGWNITVKGNWTNNGTYTPAGNITSFSGNSTQEITGATTFYDFKKTANNTVNINSNITVLNEFHLLNGTLADRGNEIMVYGNLFNNGIHDWGNAGNGISMLGTQQQVLESTGTWGKISINNPNGVLVNTTSASIFVDDAVNLIAGVFDIGKNLLVMKENAVFIPGNPFSENNMVQPNLSFTDNGIKKYFLSSYSGILTFPIGSQSKYTPVIMNIASTGAGSIRVKAANEIHPTIIEDTETCTDNIVDQSNVLKYHWTLDAKDGLSGFNADVSMKYYSADAGVVAPYTLADYITAKLILGTTFWNKYSYDDFDEANNLLLYSFINADATSINGDYTAGVQATCGGAIPDIIPAYISMATGNWTDIMNWAVYNTVTHATGAAGVNIPTGGPRGAIAIIDTPHRIVMNQNYLSNYRTTINGILDAGLSFGQRLGVVDGIGELYIESGDLPAAVYDDFILPNTGTFHFGGATNYDILSNFPQINNLKVSGIGQRRFPNIDLTMVGALVIDGTDNTLLLKNEHNQRVEVQKNITFNAGSFDAGTGINAVFVIGGTAAQTISGTGSFTGSNAFNHFVMNNSAGLTLLKPAEIDQTLSFTNGIIYTDATNTLTLNNSSETIVTGAGSTNFVDGPLKKNMLSGGSFNFPTGDDTRYGFVSLSSADAGIWTAEYFSTGHSGMASPPITSPLTLASAFEYWTVSGPGAGTMANVTLRWDNLSDIKPPVTTLGAAGIRVAQLNTGTSKWEETASTGTGNNTDGTVSTSSRLTLGTHDYTLACVGPLNYRARFAINTAVCIGTDIPIEFLGGAPLNYSIKYTDGVTTYSITGITATTTTIPTATAGVYQITEFKYNNDLGVGEADASTITVRDNPSTADAGLDQTDASMCGKTATNLNAVAPTSGTGTWSIVSGLGGFITSPNTPSSLFSGVAGETYTLRWTVRNSPCVASTDEVTISFLQNPVVAIIQGNTSACASYTDPFEVTSGYSGYSWVVEDGLGTVTGTGNSVNISWLPNSGIFFGALAGATSVVKKVTVTVTNGGCSTDVVWDVTIHRTPETGSQYHVPNNFGL
ncbi:hypothetical protein CYCD_08320 [Tenuifilaceae bacterium CYCD]|nr:hypothetical protein CYCD_08320 [Tenuifilaceae bacterium CYCD]